MLNSIFDRLWSRESIPKSQMKKLKNLKPKKSENGKRLLKPVKDPKFDLPTPLDGVNYNEFPVLYPSIAHLEGTLLEETLTALAFLSHIRTIGEKDTNALYLDILSRQRYIGISGKDFATSETAAVLYRNLKTLENDDMSALLAHTLVTRNYSYTCHAYKFAKTIGYELSATYRAEKTFLALIDHRMTPETQQVETTTNREIMKNLANLGVDFDQLILGELPIGTVDTFFKNRTWIERYLMVTMSLLRTLARTDYVSGIVPTEQALRRYNRLYDLINEDRISERFYKAEIVLPYPNEYTKEQIFAASRLNLMLGQSSIGVPFIAEYLKTAHPAYESIIGELIMSGVKDEMGSSVAVIPYRMSSVMRSYHRWLANHGYDDGLGLYTLRASLDALQAIIVESRLDITEDEQLSHMPFYAIDLTSEILPELNKI